MKSLVIVPAYNVEKRISKVLDFLKHYQSDSIIINDGSTDDTVKVIDSYYMPHIDIPVNSGLSNAILTGIGFALRNAYTHVIMIDSDGQHSPEDLFTFEKYLYKYDYVFGNRFHSVQNIPSCKIAANSLISALYKELFGVWVPDISCGYKGFKISEQIYEMIKKENNFSIVYSIVNNVIAQKEEFMLVPTKALYFQNEFLSTRRIEIVSFCDSFLKFWNIKADKFNIINESARKKKDFDVVLSGVHYYAYYLTRNDSYIIQADINDMFSLYGYSGSKEEMS